MKILAGLGNPGVTYQKTRHNAGFWLADALVEFFGGNFTVHKSKALVAEVRIEQHKLLVVKPQNFMNLSGLPLSSIARYHDVEVKDIAVAYDDVYLAPGSGRIRRGGGDGGHNGIESIIEHLGPEEFLRVRLGVGVYEQDKAVREKLPPLDQYVLTPMTQNDEEKVKKLIDNITPNLIEWVRSGIVEHETIHI